MVTACGLHDAATLNKSALSLLVRLCLINVMCAHALCLPYPAPENGVVSSSYSNPVGVSVSVSCIIGFATAGLATPACVLYPPVADSGRDTTQGNSTAEELKGYQRGARCAPIACGQFAAPEHTTVVQQGVIVFGRHATIVCDPGFRAAGLAGSSDTPACQADGSFGIGKTCERILLECLSSVSTSEDVINDGHETYQNQTCHQDTQFCVTAVKGATGKNSQNSILYYSI